MAQMQSMTGFGRGQARAKVAVIDVEVRTWNHRFLDIQLRLPESYAGLESALRREVEKNLDRGRVEIAVRRQITSAGGYDLALNESLLREISAMARRARSVAPAISEEQLIERMLARSEVFEVRERQELSARESAACVSALRAALQSLGKMRAREGLRIAKELNGRLRTLEAIASSMERLANEAPRRVQAKLHARLEQLLGDSTLDPARLASEVAVIADRLDVSEELSRFGMHIREARRALGEPPAGKRLDFLLQEMLREVNTVGSKASDAEIATFVVNAKVELERFREQVQNVE